MIVVWLFLAVPWVCLQFVIVVFPDHTYLLFFYRTVKKIHPSESLHQSIKSEYDRDLHATIIDGRPNHVTAKKEIQNNTKLMTVRTQ